MLRARRRVPHRPRPATSRPRPGERVRPVVHRTAPWIAQQVIGVTDSLEPLSRSAARAVGMARARRTLVSAGNLLARRLPSHTKNDVRIPPLTTAHPDLTSF